MVKNINMMSEDRVDIMQSFKYFALNIRCYVTPSAVTKKVTAEGSLPAVIEEDTAPTAAAELRHVSRHLHSYPISSVPILTPFFLWPKYSVAII